MASSVSGEKGGPGLSYLIAWRGTGTSRHIEADVAFVNTPITDLPARLSGPVADGAWVHVALTVAADRTATLYVNGEPVDDFQATTGAPVYGNGSIVIGNTWMWARDEFSGTTFNGCIDEVRIFGSALSAGEIEYIHSHGVEAIGVDGTCPPEEPDPENTAPTVNLDQVDGEEIKGGDTFASSAGFFTDPDEDTWTATVDYGDDDEADPEVLTLSEDKSFELSHKYVADGTYQITVTVTDDDGGVGSASATVLVNNVAPSVDEGPDDKEIDEGGTYTSSGSFTDPDEDTWTATVDYGDDPDAEPEVLTLGEGKSFELSHPYADDGTYEVTVTVTDDDGGVGSASATVVVNNVAPSVDEGPDDKEIDEGGAYTSSGSFTDPGADEWTATVDYGDGSPVENPTLVGKSFDLSHPYADDGTYEITVTVTDDEGGVGSASATVVVNNVAPSVDEGSGRQGDRRGRDLHEFRVVYRSRSGRVDRYGRLR